jgi:hypothetical protein
MWSARAHEAKRMCLGVKHILTIGGECKGWSLRTPICTPILEIAFVQELRMFRALVEKVKKIKLVPHETIRKVLKHRCLKCPHIVRLNMICMSYDQKKGWDHKPLEIRGQLNFDWGMLYTVQNIFFGAI